AAMKKMLVFILLNLLATLIPVPIAAQSGLSPRLALMKYFTAINFRNFPLAYSYWNNPPMSLSAFYSGYDDTHHILPYFGETQTNNKITQFLSVRIPVVMLVYGLGRELDAFYSCFTLSQQRGWHIDAATAAEIPNGMMPDQK